MLDKNETWEICTINNNTTDISLKDNTSRIPSINPKLYRFSRKVLGIFSPEHLLLPDSLLEYQIWICFYGILWQSKYCMGIKKKFTSQSFFNLSNPLIFVFVMKYYGDIIKYIVILLLLFYINSYLLLTNIIVILLFKDSLK